MPDEVNKQEEKNLIFYDCRIMRCFHRICCNRSLGGCVPDTTAGDENHCGRRYRLAKLEGQLGADQDKLRASSNSARNRCHSFDDDEYVYNALKYGASGYLLKGVSVTELSNAIRTVVSGGAMINPNIVTKVVKLFSAMAQHNLAVQVEENGELQLTRTERNIVCQVGRGLSNREIATKLRLSEGTVRNNLSTALSKLNLRDRTQLAIWAVQTGMVQKYEAAE